jgi:hypothetical protein
MIRRDRDRDLMIVRAITGDEKGNTGVWIDASYFAREKRENLEQQGYFVPKREDSYSELERRIKRDNLLMEQLEGERVNPMESKDERTRREGQREKGWPDPLNRYDDDEVIYDWSAREWIPIWIMEIRLQEEERRNNLENALRKRKEDKEEKIKLLIERRSILENAIKKIEEYKNREKELLKEVILRNKEARKRRERMLTK